MSRCQPCERVELAADVCRVDVVLRPRDCQELLRRVPLGGILATASSRRIGPRIEQDVDEPRRAVQPAPHPVVRPPGSLVERREVREPEPGELLLGRRARGVELAPRLRVEPHEEECLVVIARRRHERLVDHLEVEQPAEPRSSVPRRRPRRAPRAPRAAARAAPCASSGARRGVEAARSPRPRRRRARAPRSICGRDSGHCRIDRLPVCRRDRDEPREVTQLAPPRYPSKSSVRAVPGGEHGRSASARAEARGSASPPREVRLAAEPDPGADRGQRDRASTIRASAASSCGSDELGVTARVRARRSSTSRLDRPIGARPHAHGSASSRGVPGIHGSRDTAADEPCSARDRALHRARRALARRPTVPATNRRRTSSADVAARRLRSRRGRRAPASPVRRRRA